MAYDEAELSVLIVDDAEIKVLNAEYRAKDKATDVLSFPQNDPGSEQLSGVSQLPGAPQLLGDVVISLETAARQAKELEVSLAEELQRLLIHGVLHLCGYEHENVDESVAVAMREKEEELARLLDASE